MNNEVKSRFYNIIFGIILIALGLFLFVFFSIWIILVKVIDIDELIKNNLDSTINHLTINILNFMKNDQSVCIFIPIFFPLLIIFSYCKWTAFNYFKYCD